MESIIVASCAPSPISPARLPNYLISQLIWTPLVRRRRRDARSFANLHFKRADPGADSLSGGEKARQRPLQLLIKPFHGSDRSPPPKLGILISLPFQTQEESY
ncbi:uncharacterized protein LOC143198986 [Rhynchophorus ferrugineus]|uniref:uncharacterized protein LOC143198986 n=1 Tax=Rhynchophorus ferrugineus TaxID=354439 RepID=UPI003FCC8696